jgi:hypothetical protein
VKGKSPEPEDRQMEEATIPSEIKSGTHEVFALCPFVQIADFYFGTFSSHCYM